MAGWGIFEDENWGFVGKEGAGNGAAILVQGPGEVFFVDFSNAGGACFWRVTINAFDSWS